MQFKDPPAFDRALSDLDQRLRGLEAKEGEAAPIDFWSNATDGNIALSNFDTSTVYIAPLLLPLPVRLSAIYTAAYAVAPGTVGLALALYRANGERFQPVARPSTIWSNPDTGAGLFPQPDVLWQRIQQSEPVSTTGTAPRRVRWTLAKDIILTPAGVWGIGFMVDSANAALVGRTTNDAHMSGHKCQTVSVFGQFPETAKGLPNQSVPVPSFTLLSIRAMKMMGR